MGILDKNVREMTPIDVELFREAASALARSGERLEEALASLREAEMLLQASLSEGPAPDRQEALKAYRKAWQRAERARYAYIVQREALGLRTHRFVDRFYPMPPQRRIPSQDSG